MLVFYVGLYSALNSSQDHKTLIHLILALAFATPEELGFDSTISLYAEILPDDSKVIQFKMQVDDKTYVTRSPLSDYSADAIRGRAMRVWEVNEEGVPDACRVIKDVWIHTDSLSEGAQLRQLYALLQDVPASSDGRKPTDYFLSVVADEFVKVSDGRDDDTHAVLMRNRELPANAGHFQLIPQLARENRQSRSTRLSQPSHPSRPSRPTPMRGSGTLTMRAQPTGVPLPSPGCIQFPLHTKYRPRKHYRIVFQGVGVTLYKVPSLSEVLRALADATAGGFLCLTQLYLSLIFQR
jgi:hypothetical protein